MKTKLIILGLGSVVIIAGVGYLVSGMNNLSPALVTINDLPPGDNPLPENSLATTTDVISGRDSINTLLAMDRNLECTFVSGEGENRHEGSAFFSKSLVRVDTLIGNGSSTPDAAYMIMDKNNDTIYSWSQIKSEKQGVKMSLKLTAQMASGTTTAVRQPVATKNKISPDTTIAYNCKPWTVDASVFVPPNDVKFIDMANMGALIHGMMKETIPAKAQ